MTLQDVMHILLWLLIFVISFQIVLRLVRRIYKFPIPHFLTNLIDNPIRRRIQPPESGVTILVTTHYMDEAEYCTRVGFMRRGRLMAVGTPTELKESEVAGAVWRVHCTPLLASLDLLETLPIVRNVSLSGNHLRAITEEKSSAQNLKKALDTAGLGDVRIQETAPTLEDVFLSLAGN